MEGELYFRGNYLQLVRCKKISNKQFKIIEKDVIIYPEEVFETFIDVQEDLIMTVGYYLALVGRAKRHYEWSLISEFIGINFIIYLYSS